jgi:exopolysaccharide biosynthesis polyprenyl glycosylphosphotransferase
MMMKIFKNFSEDMYPSFKYPQKEPHFLIIGINERSINFFEKIREKNKICCIDFVDESIPSHFNLNKACNLVELDFFLSKKKVDKVIILLPIKSFYEKICNIVCICKEHKVDFYFPELFDGHGRGIFYKSDSILKMNRIDLDTHIIRCKKTYAIIFGTNNKAINISQKIKTDHRYIFLGFLDEVAFSERANPLVCSLKEKEISDYISKNIIDEVFVTLTAKKFYAEIISIFRICQEQGIIMHLCNEPFGMNHKITYINYNFGKNIDIDNFHDHTIVYTYSAHIHIKRLFDVSIALLALFFLAPLFVIITITIYINDGKPIFFIQERIGINKRRFKMLKFRTMSKNAEKEQAQLEGFNEVKGATFKIKNDPRITKIGKFLRKTSLDEIPQFINVIIGDMSIVGPRPLPVRDFERFYDNTHRRRFSVKPGITGPWQISGRNNLDFKEWMNLDIAYVDNWNIYKDIKILLKTIPAVLTGRGAQ